MQVLADEYVYKLKILIFGSKCTHPPIPSLRKILISLHLCQRYPTRVTIHQLVAKLHQKERGIFVE
jgi:hypothetical protein